MMCICGKLGKIEMLKSNLKVTGIVLGLLLGFQNTIQGLFLENIIDKFLNKDLYNNPTNFYVVTIVDSFFTVLAFLSIYRLVMKEIKELKAFDKMKSIQQNTSMPDFSGRSSSAVTGSKANFEVDSNIGS